LIATAMSVAQAERERMQAAGVGAAPPLKSYADALRTNAEGARAHDTVTRNSQRTPERSTAMAHPTPEYVERKVDGKPVALPSDYVAPASESSERMLDALASGVIGRRRDPNVQGSGN
jgi:hypothetical protein